MKLWKFAPDRMHQKLAEWYDPNLVKHFYFKTYIRHWIMNTQYGCHVSISLIYTVNWEKNKSGHLLPLLVWAGLHSTNDSRYNERD